MPETGSTDHETNAPNAADAPPRGESDHIAAARDALLDAMLPHVAFDGWSRAALNAAIAESGVDPGLARQAFPRGGIDAALAFHRRGDREMREKLAAAPLESMRVRDRIAFALRTRLDIAEPHREAVRRGAALTALPLYAAEGARAIWDTADAIWTAIGDDSRDVNWYTKRATLSGVYSAVLLYWLGDDSPGAQASWEFLDRRIDDVMRFEKFKARLRDNPLGKAFASGPGRFLDLIKAPGARDAPGPRDSTQPPRPPFGMPGPRRDA